MVNEIPQTVGPIGAVAGSVAETGRGLRQTPEPPERDRPRSAPLLTTEAPVDSPRDVIEPSRTAGAPTPWRMSHAGAPVRQVLAIEKLRRVVGPPPGPSSLPPATAPLLWEPEPSHAAYLDRLAKVLPMPLIRVPVATRDVWTRDMFFDGGAKGGHGLLSNPAVRGRIGESEIHRAVRAQLQGDAMAHWELPSVPMHSDLDGGGNFLATPPFAGYPEGVVFVGGDGQQACSGPVARFIELNGAQPLVTIDTSFLQVGHVDEVLTIIPWRGAANGFKILLASHALGMGLLAGHAGAPMLVGTDLPERHASSRAREDGEMARRVVARNGLDDGPQRYLDGIRLSLQALGLTDAIVEIPVVLRKRRRSDDPFGAALQGGPQRLGYEAFLPNAVNMLVATRADGAAKLIIPKQFGPVVGDAAGECLFERAIRRALDGSGNDIAFVDDYAACHVNNGNIHCSTLEIR